MKSRKILQKGKKLHILLDSKSLDKCLEEGNQDAKTILRYHVPCSPEWHFKALFDFTRFPYNVQNEILKEVNQFNFEYESEKGDTVETTDIRENENISGIMIDKTFLDKNSEKFGNWSSSRFPYKMEAIKRTGKGVLGKDYNLEDIVLIFTQSVLNKDRDSTLASIQEESKIMITENEKILKTRYVFERDFPGRELNIVNLKEAKEIMDLFAKDKDKYLFSPRYTIDEFDWYSRLFESKIPFFDRFPYGINEKIDSFRERFINLFKSIDEIGFQHYQDVSSDVMMDTSYHFNYFLSLTCGVFDSLALITDEKYDINFAGKEPHKISFRNRGKKKKEKWLNEIENNNPKLHKHIKNHTNFIDLSHEMRNRVIHRTLPEKKVIGFSKPYWGTVYGKSGFIDIDKEIEGYLKKLKDNSQEYDNISEWGYCSIVHNNNRKKYLLEPFNFAKKSSNYLINFCNKYLELSDFKRCEINENFVKHSLGFHS